MPEREQLEQDARIALLQEFSANTRNWYSVLLAMVIVLFAAVQVRDELWSMGLWWGSLIIIFSQVLYAIIRAAVSVKLARSIVRVEMPVHSANKTHLEELDDRVRKKLRKETCWRFGLALGDSALWWLLWTFVGGLPALVAVLHYLMCLPALCFCL